MAKYGMFVRRNPLNPPNTKPRNFFLNSEYKLLKIHKQQAFRIRAIFGGGTATIRYDDLGYRPMVLAYMQIFLDNGTVEPQFSLLDSSYFGATQTGEYYVEIYNDRAVITVAEMDPDIPTIADLYGYIYIFREEAQEKWP